jgi:hypothetical protein
MFSSPWIKASFFARLRSGDFRLWQLTAGHGWRIFQDVPVILETELRQVVYEADYQIFISVIHIPVNRRQDLQQAP